MKRFTVAVALAMLAAFVGGTAIATVAIATAPAAYADPCGSC